MKCAGPCVVWQWFGGALAVGLVCLAMSAPAPAQERTNRREWIALEPAMTDERWSGEESDLGLLDDDDDGPDITKPGPDMGDFPNSAATLPKGRAYLEMAPLTLSAADRYTPQSYTWPFLVRYGVTDEVEFRLLGSGLTHVGGSSSETGFSPLCFDLKVHLWDERRDDWIPASSLEVILQTDWANPAFRGGTQPALNLNFDLPLTERTNLEWTVGYAGVRDALDVATGERFVPRLNYYIPVLHRANLNTYQFSAQWAIERQVTDRFQIFVHGYYNGAIFLQQGAGSVAGIGGFWTHSKRLMLFGSCNAGLDNIVAPISGQFGFAVAF